MSGTLSNSRATARRFGLAPLRRPAHEKNARTKRPAQIVRGETPASPHGVLARRVLIRDAQMTRIAEDNHRHGDTALSHLVEHVPIGRPGDTVADAIDGLAAAKPAAADTLYVVDGERTLVGAISIRDLLQSPRALHLAKVMQKSPPSVHADTDQERVASHALKHGVVSMPVVDRGGRLLGAVPPLALLHILRHEHVEDLHRLTGIRRETKHARAALEAPPALRARHRLPWLLAGSSAAPCPRS